MFGFKLLMAVMAVCHGFNIPIPNQQAVLDIDIRINANTPDGMSMDSSEMMMRSSDTPMHSNAVVAQWNRGVLAATNTEPVEGFFIAGVGQNDEAFATHLNTSGFFPRYKGYHELGGQFDKSIAVFVVNGTVYISGTTKSGNLVLKKFASNGEFYPKMKTWIILAEAISAGTPFVASHDNKTISVVVRQKDGSLIHRTYDPLSESQSSPSIPDKKFASNPALLARPGNKLQVYATDVCGQMHFSEWQGSGSWSAWTSLGSDFVGDPATKSLGVVGDVWSVRKDGSVSARYYDNDNVKTITLGGVTCLGTGSLHYWGTNYQFVDYFCQSSAEMKRVRRDGDKLSVTGLEGLTYAAPAVFDLHWLSKTYSDLIVMGMDAVLYRKQRTAENDWNTWEPLGGKFQS